MLNYQRVGPNMSQAVTIRLDPSCFYVRPPGGWSPAQASRDDQKTKQQRRAGNQSALASRGPDSVYTVYIYICIYICIYVYICIYIHTYQISSNHIKHVKMSKNTSKDTPARNRLHFGARKVSDTVVLVLLSTYVFLKIDECVSWIS